MVSSFQIIALGLLSLGNFSVNAEIEYPREQQDVLVREEVASHLPLEEAEIRENTLSRVQEGHHQTSWIRYGDPNPVPPDSCSQYPNCVACANTHTCHWCAKDESCHTVGSVYGCLRGVECYADDRCRRKEAEALPLEPFTNLELLPLILVLVCAVLAFCSSTVGLCCACGIKGAYQKLLWSRRNNNPSREERDDLNHDNGDENPTSSEPATTTAAFLDSDAELVQHQTEPERQETGEEITPFSNANEEEFHAAVEERQPPRFDDEEQQEHTPLLAARTSIHEQTETTTEEQEPRGIGRLLRLCTCLYIFFVVAVAGMTFAMIKFYPKIPDYSVCNDAVAWTKLFENFATFKTETDIEILMSFENANRVGVALDEGHGIFKHNGLEIGNYTIPPVRVPAMSIADVLIVATMAPGAWEAVELAKEYFGGTLVLDIDVDLVVRAPWLFNYTASVSVADQPIQINPQQERHLCACKKWNGNGIHDHSQLESLPFLQGAKE